jgi:hypothetical protein
MAARNTGPADSGSRHYLQQLVNLRPHFLNELILQNSHSLMNFAAEPPVWVSPLAADNYREYRDGAFLKAVGFEGQSAKLRAFWPGLGPSWDGLATVRGVKGRGVILLEAKGRLGELAGPEYACRAGPASREDIGKTLEVVKSEMGIKLKTDWLGDFYQYANRLAHLYFLQEISKIPAWLVFVYFYGGKEEGSPARAGEWVKPLLAARDKMGLREHNFLDQRIVSVFAPAQHHGQGAG